MIRESLLNLKLSSRDLIAGSSVEGIVMTLDPAGPTHRVEPRYDKNISTNKSRDDKNTRYDINGGPSGDPGHALRAFRDDDAVSRDDGNVVGRGESQPARRKQRGFTLIEVMVALFIVAIGLGAVVDSAGNTTLHAAHLKQKTIAGWVAQNQIAEHRAKRAWGTTGSRGGDVEMANARWRWRMTISKTDDPSLRRLDIEVFLDGEEGVKATATGFIAKL